ncbi:MAG: cytochrome c maturation protein CcmE [Betaproteobacteria bacterium]|nr:cytochrome c maturation protein CcmE [Betaproteobacteria bacterium]
MKPRHQRFLWVILAVLAVCAAVAFVLNALNSNIALYITPSEVVAGQYPKDRAFRIGGMVKEGSIHRQDVTVQFVMTDMVQDVRVQYTGILPDLFKEGKGAVVQVRAGTGTTFTATEVLAKHDENYMPPEAMQAIEQAQKAKNAQAAEVVKGTQP